MKDLIGGSIVSNVCAEQNKTTTHSRFFFSFFLVLKNTKSQAGRNGKIQPIRYLESGIGETMSISDEKDDQEERQ